MPKLYKLLPPPLHTHTHTFMHTFLSVLVSSSGRRRCYGFRPDTVPGGSGRGAPVSHLLWGAWGSTPGEILPCTVMYTVYQRHCVWYLERWFSLCMIFSSWLSWVSGILFCTRSKYCIYWIKHIKEMHPNISCLFIRPHLVNMLSAVGASMSGYPANKLALSIVSPSPPHSSNLYLGYCGVSSPSEWYLFSWHILNFAKSSADMKIY